MSTPSLLKINRQEAILTLAIALSPFTELRVGSIGPSELLFVLLVFDILIDRRGSIGIRRNGLSKYYVVFLLLTIIGWFYNILSGLNSGIEARFNFLAYLFSAVCMISVEDCLNNTNGIRPRVVLKVLFWMLSIIDCLLYIYSRNNATLLGMTLLYYGYFSPLTSNIHQFAMIATPLPFIGIGFIGDYKKKLSKLLCLILCIADAYIAREIGSTKAKMGIAIGFTIYCIMLFAFSDRVKSIDKTRILLLILSISGFIVTIFYESLYAKALIYFIDNDNHGARARLYTNSIDTILNHPFIGLGPASHAINTNGKYFDAHETYLTAGMSGGLFAMIAIIRFFIGAIVMTFNSPHMMAAMVPIIIYTAGGDVLRKVNVLILTMLIAYASTVVYSDK